ncbi:PSP1 C-terminal domain-containing protein [Tundrisphaera sp. TA3]|uniref:PSP1 C-terminal domain-containing protein n=1 Tax=Tundrisphaera sp. TA3 TaxID=3435775 RepID=UPI003EBB5BE0
MGRTYLVRYGVARTIGRLAATEAHPRGQAVVIRTHRGTELGEVLLDAPDDEAPPSSARILRAADAADLELAASAALDAPRRYEACRAIFEEGAWPIDLIDVESLMDGRTVLLYFGPHQLDAAGMVAALKIRLGLDVVFEPAGIDATEPEPAAEEVEAEPAGCGSAGCGSQGCGSGGGSCGGCPAKDLVASRRRRSPITA